MHPLAVATTEAGVAIGKRGRWADACRSISVAITSLNDRDQPEHEDRHHESAKHCSEPGAFASQATEHHEQPPFRSGIQRIAESTSTNLNTSTSQF
jgi:hypothetical protein